MSCQHYNFYVTQGESYLTYVNITSSDGTPVNLSGFLARGKVKFLYGISGYIYDLQPIPILPFESGVLMFSGAATGTQNLISNSYNYDAEIFAGDYALKVLNGDFNVFPSTNFSN